MAISTLGNKASDEMVLQKMIESLMGSVKRLVFVLGSIYLISLTPEPPLASYAKGVVLIVWAVFWIRSLLTPFGH